MRTIERPALDAYYRAVVIYVFMVSGLLKWLELPFDITLLTGMIALVSAGGSLLYRNVTIGPSEQLAYVLFGCAFAGIFISAFYTDSPLYWREKALQIASVAAAACSAAVLIRTRDDLVAFGETAAIGGSVTLLLLGSIVLRDGSLDSFHRFDPFSINSLPDYLAVSSVIALGYLTNIGRSGVVHIAYRLAAILMMLLLAGRGPLIAMGLLVALDFFWPRVSARFSRWPAGICAAGVFMYIAYLSVDQSSFEVLASRFEDLLEDPASVYARLELTELAFQLIEDNPIIGIGLGGFGLEAFGADLRAYPHNMFLEVWVECGLLPLVAISAFFILTLGSVAKAAFVNSRSFIAQGFAFAFTYELLQALKSSSIADLRILFALAAMSLAMSRLMAVRVPPRQRNPGRDTANLIPDV